MKRLILILLLLCITFKSCSFSMNYVSEPIEDAYDSEFMIYEFEDEVDFEALVNAHNNNGEEEWVFFEKSEENSNPVYGGYGSLIIFREEGKTKGYVEINEYSTVEEAKKVFFDIMYDVCYQEVSVVRFGKKCIYGFNAFIRDILTELEYEVRPVKDEVDYFKTLYRRDVNFDFEANCDDLERKNYLVKIKYSDDSTSDSNIDEIIIFNPDKTECWYLYKRTSKRELKDDFHIYRGLEDKKMALTFVATKSNWLIRCSSEESFDRLLDAISD